MRQSWTDERLDDFRDETARRFDRVDADIRELRGTMKAGFERVDARFERMDARLERMDARLEALNQTIMKLGAGALVTFVVGFVGLIATQL